MRKFSLILATLLTFAFPAKAAECAFDSVDVYEELMQTKLYKSILKLGSYSSYCVEGISASRIDKLEELEAEWLSRSQTKGKCKYSDLSLLKFAAITEAYKQGYTVGQIDMFNTLDVSEEKLCKK